MIWYVFVIEAIIFAVLFTMILFACAKIAGAETFWQGFGIAFGLMVWIGAYDTFFLDWVLFANLKMFRLEGTEHMDKAYHQKWFHLKGAIFPGLVFAVIPASLVGLLIYLGHLPNSSREISGIQRASGRYANIHT